jgi:alkyl hydroperoxide reductase subunit AhpC
MSMEKDMGGVAGIGSMYGVMKEDSGYSYRAIVLINKEGVLVSRILSILPIGSEKEESNEEVKRLVKTDNTCRYCLQMSNLGREEE